MNPESPVLPPTGNLSQKLIKTFILLLLLVAAWYFSGYFNLSENRSNVIATVQCDFSATPCQIEQNGTKVTLSIDNPPISAFTPLDFRYTFSNFDAQTIDIDFQGIEMFMGANTLSMKQQREGVYLGTKTLPGHSDRGMTWRAIVTAKNATQTQVYHFEFELR